MRLLDHEPIDPDVAAELAAIDATLAGEPVDPHYAELAELALLVRGERPVIDEGAARRLDARAAQRFRVRQQPTRFRSRWVWGPAASAVALAATVAVVVLVGPLGGGRSTVSSSSASQTTSTPSPAPARNPGLQRNAATPSVAGAAAATAGQPLAPGGLTPSNPNRKVVQSSQLALTTAPNEIEKVAQEVYAVVGSENGIVQSSNVTQTGGLDGSASFQLSIPSSVLSATMARLSDLPSSQVASRTDSTQDVTNQFNGLSGQLAGARALRTALLKQLALAVTTAQIDSLNQQIHDADAEIASYQSQLNGLDHQISYSQVLVTIDAASPPPVAHGGGGLTIGKSLHTAGRVLTVAAGAALIGLAGLVPAALVVALLWWVGATVRRRRREHALDTA